MDQGYLSNDDILDFMNLVKRDGSYKIRVRSDEGDIESPFIVSSISACQFLLGGFKERLYIRRRGDGDTISSIEYANPYFAGDCSKRIAKGSKTGTIPIKSAGKIMTTEWAEEIPQIVEGNMFIKGAEKLAKKGKDGNAEKPKSFFARYWHIIVPVGIVMLISNVLNPPPPQGGGGGGGGGK